MIENFLEAPFYIQGVMIGVLISVLIEVLIFIYIIACAYWAYVDEDEGFKSFDFDDMTIRTYRNCDHAVGLLVGVIGAIASLIWPLPLLWGCTIGVANFHRAIRRLIKKVDKLDK